MRCRLPRTCPKVCVASDTLAPVTWGQHDSRKPSSAWRVLSRGDLQCRSTVFVVSSFRSVAMSDPGPLVLVVEDELQMRKFIRASLSSHGYRLLEAVSIADAVMFMTIHNPALVLLDLGLPDG